MVLGLRQPRRPRPGQPPEQRPVRARRGRLRGSPCVSRNAGSTRSGASSWAGSTIRSARASCRSSRATSSRRSSARRSRAAGGRRSCATRGGSSSRAPSTCSSTSRRAGSRSDTATARPTRRAASATTRSRRSPECTSSSSTPSPTAAPRATSTRRSTSGSTPRLRAAEARRELVVVFAHHPIASMVQPASGVHLGPGPCTSVPEPIECLFLRHRGVVAFVVGHQHRNRITPHPRAGDGASGRSARRPTSTGRSSPACSTSPTTPTGRSRSSRRVRPRRARGAGPRPPRRGALLSPREVEWLASVARELSYNDPQADNGREGSSGPARHAGRPERRARATQPLPLRAVRSA